MDAVKAGKAVDRILLQYGVQMDFEKEIRELAKEYDVPIQVLPRERMNRITRKNHQGIIAYLSLLPYYKIEDVLPLIYEKGETPLFMLLDGITDVRNFGAIARSAEIMGVHAIIIPEKGAAQINPDAVKTSAGALTKITICREKSLLTTIEFLKTNGIQTFASDLTAKKSISELDFTGPAAIVIGSEDQGVSPHILRTVQQPFIIPQRGTTDSFNVSVAAAIVLYEADRQRRLVE